MIVENEIFSLKVFSFLVYFILIIISLIDIKKKIIDDKWLFLLFVIGLLKSILLGSLDKYFIGMCIYHMPFLVLYIVEDLFNRELIGFGDIKLMIVIGGLIAINNSIIVGNLIEDVLNFYCILYIISGIFSLFLLIILHLYNKIKQTNHKISYLPFAPFIAITYILIINQVIL